MNSDLKKRPSDVAWRAQGSVDVASFLCGRCGIKKGLIGRRMQIVRGVKQYVCRGCVK